MMLTVSVLSKEEMREVLDASKETLRYIAGKACFLKAPGETRFTVDDAVKQCIQCVRSAETDEASPISIRAHATNASNKLRSALELLQSSGGDGEIAKQMVHGIERALALLHPITQAEGELVLVPRKNKDRVSRRRARKIASSRRPTLHITLGEDENTNFFCGLEKDIAKGGLFVATYNLLPVGRTVNLVVTLPDQRVLIGSGVISFVREHNEVQPDLPPAMGILLSRLTAAAREQINAYIEQNEPIFFEAV